MRDYTYEFEAGQRRQVNVLGDFVLCTFAESEIKVRLVELETRFSLNTNQAYKSPQEFQTVEIESDYAQTVTLYMGRGELIDRRQRGSGALNLYTPAHITVSAGNTVRLLDANTARKAVMLHSLQSNDVSALWGDQNTGPSQGIEIHPGHKDVMETADAVYLHNPGTSSVTIAIAEAKN